MLFGHKGSLVGPQKPEKETSALSLESRSPESPPSVFAWRRLIEKETSIPLKSLVT